MKTKICVIVTGVLLFTATQLHAVPEDKIFTSSGQILPGEEWNNVYIYNDDTIVDMLGGQIGGLWLSDGSRFNMSGGNITGSIDAHGSSYFDISDGTIDVDATVVLYGAGGSFSGGNITANGLKTGTFSMVQIEGGVLDFSTLIIQGNIDIRGGTLNISNIFSTPVEGIVNIYGGNLSISDIGFSQYTTVNIYTENFNYNVNEKVLTGYLIDDSYFSMEGVEQWEYESFNFIPEPTTLVLFGLGGLFLRNIELNNPATPC